MTAESIARRTNTYTARVLLRGDEEDGSERYKPVGGRPYVTLGTITGCKLETAKDIGLLRVKGTHNLPSCEDESILIFGAGDSVIKPLEKEKIEPISTNAGKTTCVQSSIQPVGSCSLCACCVY